jgi:flavin-dependent dehydrogenase
MTIFQQRAKNKRTEAAGPENQQVAVVGGSAAGFFTACLLARGGRPVQVFERAESLEPAARTLIVTSRLRDLLGRLGEQAVVNEIRQFEVFTDGRSATIPLHHPDLIIERATLIRGLAEQAQEAGAELLTGRRFLNLESGESGLKLALERSADGGVEQVRAGTVVGADGASSDVARAAGWPRQETVPLIQALVRLPKDLRPDTVRVWFIPEDTPYFYWLIPESPTRGALGLIGEDGQKTRAGLHRFLEKRGMEPLEFQGARIPLYKRWTPVHRQMGQADVYLVGDAAGQVKVTTVGGIVTGFRGALGVARAILSGRPDRELRSLRWELDLHLLLRRAMHHFTQSEYSSLLDLLNPQARHSLGAYTRDEVAKILWKLCLSQPRLLWLGLRGILTRGAFSGTPTNSKETGDLTEG